MTLIDLAHLMKTALTDDKMAQKKPLTLIKGILHPFLMVLCSSDTFDLVDVLRSIKFSGLSRPPG